MPALRRSKLTQLVARYFSGSEPDLFNGRMKQRSEHHWNIVVPNRKTRWRDRPWPQLTRDGPSMSARTPTDKVFCETLRVCKLPPFSVFPYRSPTALFLTHAYRPRDAVGHERPLCGAGSTDRCPRGLRRQDRNPHLVPGIESIIQAVTHQVEADHEGDDREPGPERHPWRLAEKLPGDIKHGAP